MNGPYPEWLKRRVYSDEGHLSNKTASFYLTKLVGDKTKKIVLIHLSETNNLESIAMDNLVLDDDKDFVAYEPFAAKAASYSRKMKSSTTRV